MGVTENLLVSFCRALIHSLNKDCAQVCDLTAIRRFKLTLLKIIILFYFVDIWQTLPPF